MSEIFHFKGFSYVAGGLTVDIKFDRFERQFEEAQEWLGNTVLEDCKPYMPLRTGSQRQRSHVEGDHPHLVDVSGVQDHGRRVVFPGPYARFLYGGLVMVEPDTGSPWAKAGATKVVTDRKLTFSQPMATDHWFDAAKAANIDYWLSEVKRRAGGG